MGETASTPRATTASTAPSSLLSASGRVSRAARAIPARVWAQADDSARPAASTPSSGRPMRAPTTALPATIRHASGTRARASAIADESTDAEEAPMPSVS